MSAQKNQTNTSNVAAIVASAMQSKNVDIADKLMKLVAFTDALKLVPYRVWGSWKLHSMLSLTGKVEVQHDTTGVKIINRTPWITVAVAPTNKLNRVEQAAIDHTKTAVDLVKEAPGKVEGYVEKVLATDITEEERVKQLLAEHEKLVKMKEAAVRVAVPLVSVAVSRFLAPYVRYHLDRHLSTVFVPVVDPWTLTSSPPSKDTLKAISSAMKAASGEVAKAIRYLAEMYERLFDKPLPEWQARNIAEALEKMASEAERLAIPHLASEILNEILTELKRMNPKDRKKIEEEIRRMQQAGVPVEKIVEHVARRMKIDTIVRRVMLRDPEKTMRSIKQSIMRELEESAVVIGYDKDWDAIVSRMADETARVLFTAYMAAREPGHTLEDIKKYGLQDAYVLMIANVLAARHGDKVYRNTLELYKRVESMLKSGKGRESWYINYTTAVGTIYRKYGVIVSPYIPGESKDYFNPVEVRAHARFLAWLALDAPQIDATNPYVVGMFDVERNRKVLWKVYNMVLKAERRTKTDWAKDNTALNLMKLAWYTWVIEEKGIELKEVERSLTIDEIKRNEFTTRMLMSALLTLDTILVMAREKEEASGGKFWPLLVKSPPSYTSLTLPLKVLEDKELGELMYKLVQAANEAYDKYVVGKGLPKNPTANNPEILAEQEVSTRYAEILKEHFNEVFKRMERIIVEETDNPQLLKNKLDALNSKREMLESAFNDWNTVYANVNILLTLDSWHAPVLKALLEFKKAAESIAKLKQKDPLHLLLSRDFYRIARSLDPATRETLSWFRSVIVERIKKNPILTLDIEKLVNEEVKIAYTIPHDNVTTAITSTLRDYSLTDFITALFDARTSYYSVDISRPKEEWNIYTQHNTYGIPLGDILNTLTLSI